LCILHQVRKQGGGYEIAAADGIETELGVLAGRRTDQAGLANVEICRGLGSNDWDGADASI